MRWAWLVLGVLVAGCDQTVDDEKDLADTGEPAEEDDDDPPVDTGLFVDPEWDLQTLDLTGCASAPAFPRYGASTATFLLQEPVYLEGRPITRGFVMVGGRTDIELASDRYDDLWLFDYGHAGECPWLLLDSAAVPPPGGLSDGALVFDEAREQFVYSGGYVGTAADSDVWRELRVLSADDLAAGLVPVPWQGAPGWSRFRIYSDQDCIDGNTYGYCYESTTGAWQFDAPHDPCTGEYLGTQECCTYDSNGVLLDCADLDVLGGVGVCADDPVCLAPTEPLLQEDGESYILWDQPLPAVAQTTGAWSGTRVRLFGGSFGCTSCSQDWPHLSHVNADYTTEISWDGLSGYDVTLEPWPRQDFGFADWPSDASIGARGWHATAMGREWNAITSDWTGRVSGFLLTGASVWHDYPVEWWSVLDLGVDNAHGGHNYMGVASLRTTEAESLVGGGVPAQGLWSVDNLVGAPLVPVPSQGLDAKYASRSAAYGPSSLLVVGGVELDATGDPTGSPSPWVQHLRADDDYDARTIARLEVGVVAAPIEVDPAENLAYIVRNDGVVHTLRYYEAAPLRPYNMEPNYAFDYEISAGPGQDLQDAEVDIETSITFVARCEGSLPEIDWLGNLQDNCRTEELTLEFWDPNPDQDHYSVYLKRGQGSWREAHAVRPFAAPRVVIDQESTLYVRAVKIRLPEALLDGDQVTLVAHTEQTVTTPAGDAMHQDAGGRPTRFEIGPATINPSCPAPRSDGLLLSGASVRLLETETPPGVGLGSDPEAISSRANRQELARFDTVMGWVGDANALDTTYTFHAAGVPDRFCGSVDAARFREPSLRHCVTVDRPHRMEKMTAIVMRHLLDRGLAAGSQLHLYADPCLSPDVLQDLDRYALTEGITDRVFLEDRLGPWPLGETQLVAMRPTTHTANRVASMRGGLLLSEAFTPDGQFLYGTTPEAYTIFAQDTLHEMAHAWFGYVVHESAPVPVQWNGSDTDDEATSHWLIEGYPALLEAVRYPDSLESEFVLEEAEESWSLAWVGDPAAAVLDVETDWAKDPTASYNISAYLLAQLHHSVLASLGAGKTDADVWEALAEELSNPLENGVLRELRPSQLASVFSQMGAPDFYADWVEVEADPAVQLGYSRLRKSFPQLGLAGAYVVPGGLELVVESVHDDFVPDLVGVHHDVPFYLGCVSADPAQPGVYDCDFPLNAANPPRVADSVPGTPFLASPVEVHRTDGGPPAPAYVALLAGAHLLPEHVSTYGIDDGTRGAHFPEPPTWMLLCENYADLACPGGPDSDADGWPDAADCAVSDQDAALSSGVHFGAPDTYLLGLDENCDGWPVPAIAGVL